MGLTLHDERLIARLRQGLPLVERPYEAIARELEVEEQDVLSALKWMQESGVVGRFGVIVDHQTLGFRSNAMVVWDVPADDIGEVGPRMARCGGVSLCYRRTPRPPVWPYSLYTMIHGRSRDEVLHRADAIAAACGVEGIRREVLFTARRYKQTAACYGRGGER